MPPYDDPLVIAGQGTVGREIAEDMAALGLTPDIVVAPASGGGLIAGIATAMQGAVSAGRGDCRPSRDGFDDHARSLRAGQREAHGADGRTICDALMAAIPGEITFAINSQLLAQGVTATDAEVGAAVGVAVSRFEAGGRARRRGGARGAAGRPHRRARQDRRRSCCRAAMSMRICSRD